VYILWREGTYPFFFLINLYEKKRDGEKKEKGIGKEIHDEFIQLD
jgi:hypothetical protein